MTLQSLAQQASDALAQFELRTRSDGSLYWTYDHAAAPAWIGEMVQQAHGDMLPDDHKYEFVRDALVILSEEDDPDNYSDRLDYDVDIHNHALLTWLGSHSHRAGYVNDAAREYGLPEPFDIMQTIQRGQYVEREEVLHSVQAYLLGLEAEDTE